MESVAPFEPLVGVALGGEPRAWRHTGAGAVYD